MWRDVVHELVGIVRMRWHVHRAQAGACTACEYGTRYSGCHSIEEPEVACVLLHVPHVRHEAKVAPAWCVHCDV